MENVPLRLVSFVVLWLAVAPQVNAGSFWKAGTAAVKALLDAGITFVSKTLSSDKTQRSALGVIVFSCLFLGLLSISSYTYAIFYWIYIPKVTHLLPIYLQYGDMQPVASGMLGAAAGVVTAMPSAAAMPFADVDIARNLDPNSGLKPEQHYNLGLQLWVPNSDVNMQLGNFMVTLELQSSANKTLAYSSRPALLKYQSSLLQTISTGVGILPLLFGSATESQLLRLLLIENYVEVKDMPVHRALVRVSSPRLQVYESHLTVEAHFQGLRYFMYHWSGTTAAVFISVFMFWYSMFGLILWRMFVAWFRGVGAKAKEEEEKKTAEAGGQVLGVPEDAAEAGAKERHTFDALLADRRKRTENFAGEEPVNTSSEGSNDGAAVVPGGVEDGRSMLDERRRRRELELQTKYGYQSLQRSDESPIVSPSSPDFRNRGGEDSQLRRRRSSHGGGAGSGSAPIMSPTSPTMSPERYLLLDPGLPNTSPPRQPAVGAAIYTSPMSSSHFHPSAGIPPPMPPLMTGGAQSYAFPYGAIGGGGQAGVPNVTAGFGHPSAPASMPGLQTTPAQATAEEPVSSTTVGTAVRPATIVQSSAAETPAETSGLPVVRDVFDEDRGFRSQAPE